MTIKVFKSIILCFIAAVSAASCSSDDGDTTTAAEAQLIATVEGESFASDENTTFAALAHGDLTITGLNAAAGTRIILTVQDAGEGSFDLSVEGGIQNAGTYLVDGESSAFLTIADSSGSGTVNITEFDTENKVVSGTFSFVAVRLFNNEGEQELQTVTVTNGSFNKIPLSGSDVPDGGSTSLEVEVDGAALNADAVNAVESSFNGSTTLTITATNNTSKQNVSLSFPSDISTGSYSMTKFPSAGAKVGLYSPDNSQNAVYGSGSGTLVIEKNLNGEVEGTFEFTASSVDPEDTQTYVLTNGTFGVNVQ